MVYLSSKRFFTAFGGGFLKIIHCADLHLDSKMESNLSREKALQRKEELLKAFENLIGVQAQKNSAGIIIIAGDLFDTAKSFQKTVKKQVFHVIQSHPELTFLYLKGNHDSESFFEGQERLPENLKFFSSDKWISYDFGKVCITGRELNSTVPESVYNELVLDSSRINIVVLHGETVKATGKSDAPFINLSKLKNKYIDYLALGHIHSYSCERLDKRGVYCYSGCLEGRGFDETGSKGYVLLDINEENNSVSQKFVETSVRKLYSPEINITDLEDYSDILNKISKDIDSISRESLVKVILKGEVSETADIMTESFARQLESNFFFVKVENQTEIKIDYEKYRNDISLKGEFVRTVEAQNLPEEKKARIIIAGLKALSGKEV